MPRSKGNLIQCVSKLAHHAAPEKVDLILGEKDADEMFRQRFALVQDEAQTVMRQLLRIWQVAYSMGYQNILNIIEEQVEFGHDVKTD